ncbi:MAG TPA: hypothetical protein VI643_05655 [Planctomycetota bacterium]|nr:hypothetical protein [Planctomycetota bacterium]
MDSRQKEINALEREFKDLEEQLQNECVEIGSRLQGLGTEEGAGVGAAAAVTLRKYLRNMEALLKSQGELNAQIERIQRLSRESRARHEELIRAKARVETLSQEYEKVAFDAGAAAYARFKALPDPAPYRAVFEEVLQVDAEIERLEKELKAVEEEDKARGFFGRLVSRGRSMGVRSTVGKQGKLKLEKFAAAGKAIAETDFAAKHVEGELKHLFDLICQRRRDLDEARSHVSRIEEEGETVKAELRTLGAADDPAAQTRAVEQRVADTNKELTLVRLWTGQAFVEANAQSRITDPMLKGKSTLAVSLQGVMAEKRRRIARLKAEVELEGLEGKARSLQKKQEQLESEIRLREEQIRSVKGEASRVRQRIDDLRRLL